MSSKAYQAALTALKTDLKTAMRAKDTVTRDTIKSLLAAIKNKELDIPQAEKHNEFLLFELFTKNFKQRKDSAAEYAKLGRPELQEKELGEANIIEKYLNDLPVASESEIDAKVKEFLKDKSGNIGQILKQINWEQVREEWKADEKLFKRLVAQNLKK